MFRAVSLVSIGVVLAATPASALIRSAESWLPTMAAVQRVEAKVHLPDDAQGLGSYVRFYTGVVDNGRKIIEGVYLARSVMSDMHRTVQQAINIVAEKDIPFIMDGGCLMVTVYYDVDSDTVTEVRCNGFA